MISRLLTGMLLAATASAADLSATGGWFESVTAANLSSGAGSDLVSPLDSASGTTVLTISAAPGAWQVKARLANGALAPGVTIWVRRVSAGSGSGTIAGGSTFVQLGATDIELFSGSEDRSSISLQFRSAGLNRTVAPGNYTSSIIFTVQ